MGLILETYQWNYSRVGLHVKLRLQSAAPLKASNDTYKHGALR